MNILLRHEIIISIKIRYIPLTAGGNANLSIWQYSYTMKLISLREKSQFMQGGTYKDNHLWKGEHDDTMRDKGGTLPPFTVHPFVLFPLMPPYVTLAVLTRILSALASLIPLIFISSFFGA